MLQGWWYKYKERDDYIHCYLRNKNIIIQTKRVNSVERKRTAKIQKKKKKKIKHYLRIVWEVYPITFIILSC
jgi:hypothetical protein